MSWMDEVLNTDCNNHHMAAVLMCDMLTAMLQFNDQYLITNVMMNSLSISFVASSLDGCNVPMKRTP